ncbi:protein kinase [Streptomyces dysideae]|uniref:Protein kinase domain-containing protein n=1 Tax=Streptomyces dysideae TaxID=909626 RepID=A0A101UPF1_9ACTN|nr:hypothetical protein AQJ91_46550 [Streptomyces dysideae]
MIHRDIEPANVMLTADRTLKPGDFGIARFAAAASSRAARQLTCPVQDEINGPGSVPLAQLTAAAWDSAR